MHLNVLVSPSPLTPETRPMMAKLHGRLAAIPRELFELPAVPGVDRSMVIWDFGGRAQGVVRYTCALLRETDEVLACLEVRSPLTELTRYADDPEQFVADLELLVGAVAVELGADLGFVVPRTRRERESRASRPKASPQVAEAARGLRRGTEDAEHFLLSRLHRAAGRRTLATWSDVVGGLGEREEEVLLTGYRALAARLTEAGRWEFLDDIGLENHEEFIHRIVDQVIWEGREGRQGDLEQVARAMVEQGWIEDSEPFEEVLGRLQED